MDLVTVWFVILAVLWTGFFFLEGFDFGVGMLASRGRDDAERRQMLSAIGPVWDADEVWLVTGGIALFAAFPVWYATAFSAAYIPLVLVIAAIIVRGVAIEYRSKRPEHRWRQGWDIAIATSSALLPLLFGVFWAGMLHGLPLNADGDFVGRSLWSFINGYSLLGGLTLLTFSLAHGSAFLALKTDGAVRARHERLAVSLGALAAVMMLAFTVWTYVEYTDGDAGALAAGLVSVVTMTLAVITGYTGRLRVSFWLHGAAVAGFVAQIFIGLYPLALPTTLADGSALTLADAASGPVTLQFITVIAAIGMPLVIAYQAWSFWVFRKRIAKPADDVAQPSVSV